MVTRPHRWDDARVRPAHRPHILFDFFGTLVAYTRSRADQGYARSYDLVRRFGADLDYQLFLDTWVATWSEFDQRSAADHREFPVTDVSAGFLTTVLGRRPSDAEVETFTAVYVREWSAGVRHLPGVADMIRQLADGRRLAVVSNAHEADLVSEHLKAMGLLPYFDAVITSIEVGWRKPHPAIYTTALSALGIDAEEAVFVGDTYEPDFVGPERLGIRAFLIDPDRQAAVPEERRLTSILDLPNRLRG